MPRREISKPPRGSQVLLALVAALWNPGPAFAGARPAYAPDRILVRYQETSGPSGRLQVRARVSAMGARALPLADLEVLAVPEGTVESALEAARRDPNVLYAEPDWIVTADRTPNDPRFSELYALRNTGQTGGAPGADIGAVTAWDLFTGSASVLVGVIDTGVDYHHADLAANCWVNPGEIPGNGLDDDGNGYKDDVHGFDFVHSADTNGDGDFADPEDVVDADNALDDHHHGTHVAGTIGAVGDNALGVVGVSWQVRIVPIKFLDAAGAGTTSNAIQALAYAVRVGVAVTNNSWGGGAYSQALFDAIEAAGAAGQLFVAAAGNFASDNDVEPDYPSAYPLPSILSVLATDDSDQPASFTNYGATTVDLGAPGVDILSCQRGGGYEVLSGTSMATPHVTGVAALVKGRFPALTPAAVKDRILRSVDPVPVLAGRCVTGGRLNATLAIADPDAVAPAGALDLVAIAPGSTTMELRWTCVGDDGSSGTASRYDLRYSTAPIDAGNFEAATPAPAPAPLPAGALQGVEISGLGCSTTYYFALKAVDEWENSGPLSNVASGRTLGPPRLTLDPAALACTLLAGFQSEKVLVLGNSGEGTLDFSIPLPEILPPAAPGAPIRPRRHPVMELAKGAIDPRRGSPVPAAHGGPDAFGYRWIDGRSAGGAPYLWIDIRSQGTRLDFTEDDQTIGVIPVGFDFPFYGETFSSVRVCNNGWLSFTATNRSYANQPLPTGGASYPANLIAPFWDDLSLGDPVADCYTYADGKRFVVSWLGFVPYGDPQGGPYSFQAVLYPSGEILFQYQDMDPPLDSATIGIQNATRDVGLQVCFNQPYVENGLTVRILPLSQWLAVSPSAGRIPAGSQQSIQVLVDATGLDDGLYDGTIHVLTNEPAGVPAAVAARLRVTGAPDLGTSGPLDFGTVFLGSGPSLTLTVSNIGSAPLEITGIHDSEATLAVNPATFVLEPRTSADVEVTWSPVAAGSLATSLEIESNDPGDALVLVPVIGDAVLGPELSLSATTLGAVLSPGGIETQVLRIYNSTRSLQPTLDFSIGTTVGKPLPGPGSSERGGIATRADVSPKERRARLQGAGGPDAFGYRWKDSDEPDGPAFEWVDITGIGTPIPFSADDENSGPLPIGFAFPFYGQSFTTASVCTNGWLSFTNSQGVNWYNVPLPSPDLSDPDNMLAVFWDDLNFAAGGEAYAFSEGSRFIVSWVNVPHSGTAVEGPYTFQVILYPSGKIVYQYASMQPPLDSATIGTMDATHEIGLNVVWNDVYVHDGLAIEIQWIPEWLRVTPLLGSVTGLHHLDLTVTYDSQGLQPGTYEGTIRIASNDPDEGLVLVPVQLRVASATDVEASIPRAFGLALSTANPARGELRFTAALPNPSPVDIRIYDVRGALVRELGRVDRPAGYHPFVWDGSGLHGTRVASGVYFVRLQVPGVTRNLKVTILR